MTEESGTAPADETQHPARPMATGMETPGPMETGPAAGAGAVPEVADVDPAIAAVRAERGPDGPVGSQDSSEGDLAEAGD